ncbi:MAG TPA: hypothetical protein VGX68_26230 [Thermoanaerobaculia bacterium]|jgi:hypothetical protein|nr:hypothetical protein [Thermoanaerobaculia bacterium]
MNAQTGFRRLALGVSLLLAGCSAVRVRPVDPHEYDQRRRGDVLITGGLSAATRESLRILGLPEEGCQGPVFLASPHRGAPKAGGWLARPHGLAADPSAGLVDGQGRRDRRCA